MNNKMTGAQSLRSRWVSALAFDYCRRISRVADRAQEKTAGPERLLVLAQNCESNLFQKRGSGLALECSDGFAQHDGRRMAQQETHMIGFASEHDKQCEKALDFKRYENHRVSKAIVDYARAHRRAVVLEDLGELRSKRSKARSYTERSQWSFYQLRQFILYKAALSGVMVFEVSAAYSSQECSRCHALTKPAGKKFVCLRCGHKDHKDANAAFALAERVMPTCGLARESESPAFGPIGGPLSGNGVRGLTTRMQQTESQEFTL